MSADTLNPAQQQAVRVSGHCVITAPPGSGKTKVLEHRAAFLLGADPIHAVLGVTFTADAAAELEARARKLVPAASKRLICGTFHSLCKRQLEQAGQKFVLVNEVQQMDLMRRAYVEIVKGMPDDQVVPFEKVVEFIGRYKSAVEPITLRTEDVELQVALRYRDLLEQMGAMDFADLLLGAVRGMKLGNVKPWAVTHMLVDECQDSDDVQYGWIREHSRRGVLITVVGDDDQSIYGWRSARGFGGLEDFRREHAAAHISLNITYRCAREIITPAAKLIGHNTERVPKSIQTANRGVGTVMVKHAEDEREELVDVAAHIIQSGSFGDWGVLARSNDQLDALERVLEGKDVKYHRSGGVSFWDLKGPSLFLGVCGSLVGNNLIGVDDLLRKCNICEDLLRRIHAGFSSNKSGALKRFVQGPAQNGFVGDFQNRLKAWDRMLHSGQERLALHGVADFIKKNAKVYEKDRNPLQLAKDHEQLDACATALSNLRGGLGSRLGLLKNREKQPPSDGNVARIMTVHASKGLEFRKVWIIGCEQGVMPSSRSADLAEERRLFYVGMTRAKESLFLSYPLREKGQRSIFLTEAGL